MLLEIEAKACGVIKVVHSNTAMEGTLEGGQFHEDDKINDKHSFILCERRYGKDWYEIRAVKK